MALDRCRSWLPGLAHSPSAVGAGFSDSIPKPVEQGCSSSAFDHAAATVPSHLVVGCRFVRLPTPPPAMFSPSLGRMVRTTCALSPSSAISSRPLGALAAANNLLARASQPRRNSSTSCPPDNSRGPGTSQTTTSSSSKQAEKKAAPRGRSKKLAQQQMNVPSVPPTSYLQETGA